MSEVAGAHHPFRGVLLFFCALFLFACIYVWGAGLPVEEVAGHADTIPYELLCGVSQRVPLELK